MKKKMFWKILLTISLTGCVGCLGFTAWYLYQDYQAQKEYEALQREMALEESLKEQEENSITLEEIENMEFTGERDGEEAHLPEDIFLDLENPIDFKELTAINKDIYAWIRIPNTKIDYPILQKAGDDSFYLKHDIYKQPRLAGSIYTEDCNKKDFSDPNTVIYGHNMRNLTMFQNLHLFADKDFFDENPYVYIYTPDQILVYEIFASYTYDDRHIMNSFDFSDPKIYEQYLQNIFAVRAMDKNLREDIIVTGEDKIITMATCIGGKTDARYLVQAVLVHS